MKANETVMHRISIIGYSLILTVLFLSFSFSGTLLAQPAGDGKNGREKKVEEKKNGGKKDDFLVYSSNPLVAEVDGQPIYLDNLKNAQIHKLMERLHLMLDDSLKQNALKLMSESHPELVLQRPAEITDKDIEHFYQSKPEIKKLGSLEQLRRQIRNFLENKQRQLAMKNLDKKFQQAADKGWVVNHLKPPNDFRLKANVGTAMLWFNGEDAKNRQVFVMEYSDFLCPFCRKVQRTLSDLRNKYINTVQFGYRHFPVHPEARNLSEAVECARDQGRFWQLQSLVFLDARRLQRSKLELIRNARIAGVRDVLSFEKCIDSGKYQERVQKDYEEGASLGIQGTPTFIIGVYNHSNATVNGEMFSGAVPPAKFVNLIEKYLKPSPE